MNKSLIQSMAELDQLTADLREDLLSNPAIGNLLVAWRQTRGADRSQTDLASIGVMDQLEHHMLTIGYGTLIRWVVERHQDV